MKLFTRFPLRNGISSTVVPGHKTRRGLLHTVVASLAAYSTSLFFANSAQAFSCTECQGPCGSMIGEGQCRHPKGQCFDPSGPRWGWEVYTGPHDPNDPFKCCNGEMSGSPTICCEPDGGIPPCF